ncbi:uncharacterized protein LOC112202908 [Rosa chinensis]|uniref:uncharacterized protein LOC112202908 n=1 Tax=Rosa chinensis TaxID=74649 RepID=UPI000D094705|nr:uncharacterized protein LOC112202908 [Rosa chinensis]
MRCLLCPQWYETVSHVFCGCSVAKEILTSPPFSMQLPISPSFMFKEWMLEQAISLSDENFAKLLMMILWGLWKNRNEKLWNDSAIATLAIVASTMAWFEEYSLINKATGSQASPRIKGNQPWRPPIAGMLKLNTDRAFLQSATHGGVGGVLRNEKGEFIAGFVYHKEYVTSGMHVELLAIKHGLELLQAMTVTNVIVQSDCLLAVKAI